MPAWFYAISGSVLLIALFVDVAWSTLSTHGAGPLSRWLTLTGWKLFRSIHRHVRSHKLLKINVVILLITNFAMWVTFLWVGWALVFMSADQAVVFNHTGDAAVITDRFYFTGMTLLTLGTGDLVAGTPAWRMVMALASLNGLAIITLVIAYLLPVVSAEIDRRQLALSIWALGEDATAILSNSWQEGAGFEGLDAKLYAIAEQLILHAERHLAYPILQFFHAADRRAELAARVVTLDDATTLLECCIADDEPDGVEALSASTLRALRLALDRYIRRVDLYHVHTADTPPPAPDFEALRKGPIPLRDQATCEAAFTQMGDHRKLLQGFLRADGWQWGD